MFAYVVRRLLVSIPILLVSTFLVFLMVSASGDPLSDIKHHHPPVPQSTIHIEEHRLMLDRPLLVRYGLWVKNIVLHGDFGPSINQNMNIRATLVQRLEVTMRLVLLAMFLAAMLAVVVGVVSAVKQYSGVDYTFTFAGFLFLSMPVFWLAVLLKEYATKINLSIGHRIFYTIGEDTPNLQGNFWTQFTDAVGHLILPTLVLAMTSFAAWSRFQRASMLDVLNSDYVRLARAKGLSRRRVMVRHALRTALIPLVTVVAIDFAALLSGTIITETIFNWQGMGRLLLQGIQQRDVYVVLAWLLVAAFLVIMFNLIADILYALLDPRIRYE